MTTSSKIAAAVWVLASLLLVALSAVDYEPQFRLYYSNALQTLTSLVSAALCLRTMSSFPEGSPLRKAWGLIGAGVLLWGIGATIFAAYPILNAGQDTPYPYFSDIGYLATGPLVIAGLLSFKRSTGLVAPFWGKLLAFILLAVSGYWSFQANKAGLFDSGVAMTLTSAAYTLFDPVVLATTVLTASAFRGGEVGQSWWYVVFGVLLYFIANQLYTYLVMTEQYLTGSWIDVGWMLGFGLIAWAAVKTRNMVQ